MMAASAIPRTWACDDGALDTWPSGDIIVATRLREVGFKPVPSASSLA